MLQKLDNTQNGSVEIAIGKARAALDFRRPSKAMQDVVAGGGCRTGLSAAGASHDAAYARHCESALDAAAVPCAPFCRLVR